MYENMPNNRQNNVLLTNVVSTKSGFDNQTSPDSGVSACGDSSSNGSPKPRTSKSEPVYYVADSTNAGNEKQVIAVIGSGNFGRALALKIAQSGYHVNIGSRNPEKHR